MPRQERPKEILFSKTKLAQFSDLKPFSLKPKRRFLFKWDEMQIDLVMPHVYLHLISLNDFLTPHVCPETSVEEISLKLASIFIASRHAPESNFLIY